MVCRRGERINGRWAMLAVLGILVQEATGAPSWWEAGAKVRLMVAGPLAIRKRDCLHAFKSGMKGGQHSLLTLSRVLTQCRCGAKPKLHNVCHRPTCR